MNDVPEPGQPEDLDEGIWEGDGRLEFRSSSGGLDIAANICGVHTCSNGLGGSARVLHWIDFYAKDSGVPPDPSVSTSRGSISYGLTRLRDGRARYALDWKPFRLDAIWPHGTDGVVIRFVPDRGHGRAVSPQPWG